MLRAYLRLLLFAAGLLAGVQVPGFVHQYQVVVLAHLAEARRALESFADIAARHFGGDLPSLIAHYRANADTAIRETGDGVAAMVRRVADLDAERAALSGPWQERAWHVATAADRVLLREAAAGYDHQVPLQPTAIGWGLGVGLSLALTVEGLIALLALTRRRRAPQRA